MGRRAGMGRSAGLGGEAVLVKARLGELTTEALRARLADCEKKLAAFGLRDGDRAQVEKEKRAIEAVIALRERNLNRRVERTV